MKSASTPISQPSTTYRSPGCSRSVYGGSPIMGTMRRIEPSAKSTSCTATPAAGRWPSRPSSVNSSTVYTGPPPLSSTIILVPNSPEEGASVTSTSPDASSTTSAAGSQPARSRFTASVPGASRRVGSTLRGAALLLITSSPLRYRPASSTPLCTQPSVWPISCSTRSSGGAFAHSGPKSFAPTYAARREMKTGHGASVGHGSPPLPKPPGWSASCSASATTSTASALSPAPAMAASTHACGSSSGAIVTSPPALNTGRYWPCDSCAKYDCTRALTTSVTAVGVKGSRNGSPP